MWRTWPTADEVVAFMGWPASTPVDAKASVKAAIDTVLAMAKAYTRGRGFHATDPMAVEEDVYAVIVSAAARLASNPTNARRIEAGAFNTVPGTFEGWTLPELAVLHSYRRRAA